MFHLPEDANAPAGSPGTLCARSRRRPGLVVRRSGPLYGGPVDRSELRAYCEAKPGAWPDFPWDHDFPVIKVGEGARGRIFAFLWDDSVGVKGGVTREIADEWLHRHPRAATVMRYRGGSG